MGEIKGTILAMIMAVSVFAVVGGMLYRSFQGNAETVSAQLDSEFSFLD